MKHLVLLSFLLALACVTICGCDDDETEPGACFFKCSESGITVSICVVTDDPDDCVAQSEDQCVEAQYEFVKGCKDCDSEECIPAWYEE
jgi:hypothetical protein